ncbi:hypothetical protein [Shewanella sp.]|uniref:hypothetical protein n=1 Tax=Shewanella sp. TaxID=50422 RepID=UPI00404863CA
MRIGIDFDNTIACYDRAFEEGAALMGFSVRSGPISKSTIKQRILENVGGELEWQRLQGQVYGKHMLRAEIFPGLVEFLYLCRARGHQLFVVSHKSEFGHYDDARIPLRDQARKWMQINGLFADDPPLIAMSDLYFEPTREAKVARIQKLDCTHFIDDLPEVFEERSFPKATTKILFAPGSEGGDKREQQVFASWRELGAALLGTESEAEMATMVARRFPKLGVKEADLRKGGGNSRLYRLGMDNKKGVLALKVYPDRQHDTRSRLQTEFYACKELDRLGYPVPKPYEADAALNWGLYEWVDGDRIDQEDERFLAEAGGFIERLYLDSRSGSFSRASNQWGLASEACLSGAEIVRQIEGRLSRLIAIKSPLLQQFLNEEFEPVFAIANASARKNCGDLFATEIAQGLRIVSPSDFGSHNALRLRDGSALFLDFEYFGWDDPVKLVADFYWHPAMSLGTSAKARWLAQCSRVFRADAFFERRLVSYLPLFGLKWSLIILNEFLPRNAAVRLHADPQKADDLVQIRTVQLGKSVALLRQIKEKLHELG